MFLTGWTISLPEPIAYLIFISFFVIVFSLLGYLRITRRKRAFISKIIHLLMEHGATKIKVETKQTYQISYQINLQQYYLKITIGGRHCGFVMTNPSTIFRQYFANATSAHKSSEIDRSLSPFLSTPLEGKKVLLVYGNLIRATRYINECEIVGITYLKDSFNVRIVEEKDFCDYLTLVKKEDNNGKTPNKHQKR